MSVMVRKSRTLPVLLGRGEWVEINFHPTGGKLKTGVNPGPIVTPQLYSTVMGSQVTDSENHKFRRLNASSGDVGGPFYSQRRIFEGKPKKIQITTGQVFKDVNWAQIVTASGDVYPASPTSATFPPSSESTDAQLTTLGATAVKLTKPGNSSADLAVFLGELKQGLPKLGAHLWEEVTDLARSAGKDYLNVQFGWRPLISDVKNFANAILHAERYIRQYERDAGRVVRRRFEFPSISSTVSSIPLNRPPYMGNRTGGPVAMIPSGDILRVRETSRRQWFSGAFTYYLPTDYDSRKAVVEFASRAKFLLGLQLTPEVLWELAPWSWAIDWFSNVGDVISNVTDFQSGSLVMRYGYLMEHSIVRDTYTRVNPVVTNYGKPHVVDSSFSYTTETKKRIQANPFGFGVTWSGLSPFQLSIAAALGLSRK